MMKHYLAFVAVAGAIVVLLYGSIAEGALLGFDAYPLIAASSGPDGVGQIFGDELMGGRYSDGRFYRPLVHLSFAADAAGDGGPLNPLPYRRTDLAIATLTAAFLGLIVSLLARPMASPRGDEQRRSQMGALFGGIVAALAYVAHSVQFEVVPFAPRRADALATALVAATVAAALAKRPRPWLVGCLTLGALFAKETGVLAVPLVLVAALLKGRPEVHGEDGEEGPSPVPLALAPVIALALGLAARFLVLGELGGHGESGLDAATGGIGATATSLGEILSVGVPGGVATTGLLTLLLGLNLLLVGNVGRTALALCLTWGAGVIALTAFSGRVHPWYGVALLPGVVILAGTGVAAAWCRRSGAGFGAAAAGLALVGFMAGATLTNETSGMNLDFAGRVATDQVARFRARLETLAPGERVTFEPYLIAVQGEAGAAHVYLHAPYSLAALAELVRPDLGVLVLPPGAGVPGDISPQTAVIQLVQGPPPASLLGQ